jgi:hypothetical protein
LWGKKLNRKSFRGKSSGQQSIRRHKRHEKQKYFVVCHHG